MPNRRQSAGIGTDPIMTAPEEQRRAAGNRRMRPPAPGPSGGARPDPDLLSGARGEGAPLRAFLRRHYVGLTTAAEAVADVFCLGLSFLLGARLDSWLPWAGAGPGAGGYLRTGALAALAGIVVFERMGLYRRQASVLNVEETRRVIKAVAVLAAVLIAWSYFTRTEVSPVFLVLSLGASLFLLTSERMAFYKLHQGFHLRGINLRRVLICGAGEVGRQLFQKISHSPKLGYHAVGFYDEDPMTLNKARERIHKDPRQEILFLEKKEEFLEAVMSRKMDEVLIARPSLRPDGMQEIMGLCRKFGIRFGYVPYLHGYFVEQIRLSDIDGIPLITAGRIRASRADRLGKRLFDAVLSTVSLLLLWPLLALIALLVRIDSPGPALFTQTRVGRNGREFRIFKFRTLYTDTPAYMTSPNSPLDPRITSMGRLLRRSSLDELPQLLNVVRGEMSLVGPRPEMPFIVAGYSDLERERLGVRPGITGLWQISADRDRPIHENILYDIYYIKNRSFLLDLAILLRTALFAVISMKTC